MTNFINKGFELIGDVIKQLSRIWKSHKANIPFCCTFFRLCNPPLIFINYKVFEINVSCFWILKYLILHFHNFFNRLSLSVYKMMLTDTRKKINCWMKYNFKLHLTTNVHPFMSIMQLLPKLVWWKVNTNPSKQYNAPN